MALVDDDWAGARCVLRARRQAGARDDPGGEWLLPHAQAALAPVVALLGDGRRAADSPARRWKRHGRSRCAPCWRWRSSPSAARRTSSPVTTTRAAVDIEELLHLLRELGTRRWLADVVELTAVVLARRERYDVAANALGTAAKLRAAARNPAAVCGPAPPRCGERSTWSPQRSVLSSGPVRSPPASWSPPRR